jgi:hypothetical protein
LRDSRGVNGFSASKSGSDAETTAFFRLGGCARPFSNP